MLGHDFHECLKIPVVKIAIWFVIHKSRIIISNPVNYSLWPQIYVFVVQCQSSKHTSMVCVLFNYGMSSNTEENASWYEHWPNLMWVLLLAAIAALIKSQECNNRYQKTNKHNNKCFMAISPTYTVFDSVQADSLCLKNQFENRPSAYTLVISSHQKSFFTILLNVPKKNAHLGGISAWNHRPRHTRHDKANATGSFHFYWQITSLLTMFFKYSKAL